MSLKEFIKLKEDKNWIQKAVGKHPGKLHKALGVPEDEKIPEEKLEVKPGDSPKLKKEKILAKTLKKLRHHHESVHADNYYMLEECDDASEQNKLANGREPDKNVEDEIEDELVEDFMLDECDFEDASDSNEIDTGKEPKDVEDTANDIEDELSNV